MRLQETEGSAGQASRAAAKGSIVARRDPMPIQRFTITEERGATERSRLEQARTDRKTIDDLVGRREAQRSLDRRAETTSMSERRATHSEALSEGRDQARSTEPSAVSSRQANAGAAGTSSDQTNDLGKAGRSPSDARLTPMPLGRVLAEAASAPAGRNVTDTASEAEGRGASTEPKGDDGRGLGVEGEEAQGQAADGKDAATAAIAASPLPLGTTPIPASAPQTSPLSAEGSAPAKLQRTDSDRQGHPGNVPAVDSTGPGSAAIEAASAEAASATSAATEKREGGSTFADVLGGVSPDTVTDAMPATPAGASPGTTSANPVAPPPASLPTPHQGSPVPLGAVPMTIGLRSLSGSSHFEIRLDPVDLGRIDVKLEIDKDRGTVTTSVVVDRADTLALLQRDSGNLQQALAQAGLDPGAGINLSLRGDGMAGDQGASNPRSDARGTDALSGSQKTDPSTPQPLADYVAPRMLRGIAGIDIRI